MACEIVPIYNNEFTYYELYTHNIYIDTIYIAILDDIFVSSSIFKDIATGMQLELKKIDPRMSIPKLGHSPLPKIKVQWVPRFQNSSHFGARKKLSLFKVSLVTLQKTVHETLRNQGLV